MKVNADNNENYAEIFNNLVLREKLEKQATGVLTSDILTRLNVSIESLPQKCQHLLDQVAHAQAVLGIDKLDSATLALRCSREQADKLEEEYEILQLKQKNAELQTKIDRNKKFVEGLRRELTCSRDALAGQEPNPGNVHEYIRRLRQKVGSYEESCEKAKMKYSKLSVPEAVLPTALQALLEARDALQREAGELRARADDVALARRARDALARWRNPNK